MACKVGVAVVSVETINLTAEYAAFIGQTQRRGDRVNEVINQASRGLSLCTWKPVHCCTSSR